jgi:hypothetical protein
VLTCSVVQFCCIFSNFGITHIFVGLVWHVLGQHYFAQSARGALHLLGHKGLIPLLMQLVLVCLLYNACPSHIHKTSMLENLTTCVGNMWRCIVHHPHIVDWHLQGCGHVLDQWQMEKAGIGRPSLPTANTRAMLKVWLFGCKQFGTYTPPCV